MNEFNITNETDIKVEFEKDLEELVKYSLDYLKLENTIFDIIFVDDKRIKEINKEYRFKDMETDVISFALEDEGSINLEGIRVLGDIYISLETAEKQALKYSHSYKREVSFLIIHGLLHLLGYSHGTIEDEKQMFELQERILEDYGIRK